MLLMSSEERPDLSLCQAQVEGPWDVQEALPVPEEDGPLAFWGLGQPVTPPFVGWPLSPQILASFW